MWRKTWRANLGSCRRRNELLRRRRGVSEKTSDGQQSKRMSLRLRGSGDAERHTSLQSRHRVQNYLEDKFIHEFWASCEGKEDTNSCIYWCHPKGFLKDSPQKRNLICIIPCWKLSVERCRHLSRYGFGGWIMAAYRQITSYPEKLLFSDKSQTKACQLQNRDRFEGRIIAAYRQLTSYPNNQKSKHSGRYYLLADKWPERQA